MYHTIIIVGNLGKDPEMRYTPSGQAVTNFNVATNRQYAGSDGNQVKETIWFRISAWGKQAETVSTYLTKGRAVAVEGRLQQDTWETEAGERRSRLKVVAQRVTFLSSAHGQPAPAGETAPDWVTEEAER